MRKIWSYSLEIRINRPQRLEFERAVARTRSDTSEILLRLLAVSSENPPGDTTLVAREVRDILQQVEGIDTQLVAATPEIENVVAVIRGCEPGRRLIFNGHLDTFEIGDTQTWSKDPYGQQEDGRIYGRGSSDMKGGLAAQVFAISRLAEFRNWWNGELVLILTGDEETAGPHGTRYLLEHCELAVGDAMICADAGSPHVLRFGEKGWIWLTIKAEGRAGHGAHVHLGVSAIDRLLVAISALRTVTRLFVQADENIEAFIDAAGQVSEEFSGKGETQILKTITVNVGTISGGSVCNAIAETAEATVDIRLPQGVKLDDALSEVGRLLGTLPGVSYRIDSAAEATVTDPRHEIVQLTSAVCDEVLRRKSVTTMRVGASDASQFRDKGIPSVVCGLTPFNMGGSDEYVLTEELYALGEIYALTAFDYLSVQM